MSKWPWLLFPALVLSLYLGLVYAPPDAVMGDSQRIMYFHVPAAWNAFLAFFVVAASSVLYLRSGRGYWDRLAAASAEVGVLFTTLALVTGSVWAKAAWGTWWDWEPRLTTTLLLWFIYVAYGLLRAYTEGEGKKARLAAVFGIIGFVDVPIVYFSTQWFRGLHPAQVTMDGRMVLALMVGLAVFTGLYLYLLQLRLRLETLASRLREVRYGWQQGEGSR